MIKESPSLGKFNDQTIKDFKQIKIEHIKIFLFRIIINYIRTIIILIKNLFEKGIIIFLQNTNKEMSLVKILVKMAGACHSKIQSKSIPL